MTLKQQLFANAVTRHDSKQEEAILCSFEIAALPKLFIFLLYINISSCEYVTLNLFYRINDISDKHI